MPAPNAWLTQQLNRMQLGIGQGKTRRRKVQSMKKMKVTEAMVQAEVKNRGWRVAQIGDDFVFAPGNYTIRPIV
jgi:hypothetical protein